MSEPRPQPNDERGVPRANVYDPEAHTNPEDTLLEQSPAGTGKVTPQRSGTGSSGAAISWLLVVAVLAVLVLLGYGLIGR